MCIAKWGIYQWGVFSLEKSYGNDADICQKAAAVFKLAQLVPVVMSNMQKEFAFQSPTVLLSVENAVKNVGKEFGAFPVKEILRQWVVARKDAIENLFICV